MTATLKLLPGKDKSIKARHPWIFAGAIAELSGRAKPGDTVDVVAANGRPLARFGEPELRSLIAEEMAK
jgi:23S rRNA (cytosine1962-C5)-methyltransferase